MLYSGWKEKDLKKSVSFFKGLYISDILRWLKQSWIILLIFVFLLVVIVLVPVRVVNSKLKEEKLP